MNGVVVCIVFFSVYPQVKLWRPKDLYDEKVFAPNQGLGRAVARMKGGNSSSVITRCCLGFGSDLTRCFFDLTRCFFEITRCFFEITRCCLEITRCCLEITRCCLSWRISDKIFAFSDKIFIAENLQMIIVMKAHACVDI